MKRHLKSETFVRAFLVASILILGPTWVTVSTYAQGSSCLLYTSPSPRD